MVVCGKLQMHAGTLEQQLQKQTQSGKGLDKMK